MATDLPRFLARIGRLRAGQLANRPGVVISSSQSAGAASDGFNKRTCGLWLDPGTLRRFRHELPPLSVSLGRGRNGVVGFVASAPLFEMKVCASR